MNLHRLTPSISLLVAFEAAARHRSFTRAGQELSLTQSAVSRQVQALESLLDVKLFQRSGRQIALTEIGAIYAADIASALGRIRSASSQVMALQSGGGSLNLAVLPTFASRWLLPLLPSFYRKQPGVLVHLYSRIGRYNLGDAGMDAAINVGDGHWPSLTAHRLVDEEQTLVANPVLLGRDPIRVPGDVVRHLLLHLTTRAQEWREWFSVHQIPVHNLRAGPQFELTAHLIQAAVLGIGIALVSRCLVEEELRNGTLVSPLAERLPARNRGYYLIYPPEKASFPPLVAFREWLLPYAATPGAVPAPPSRSRTDA
jgi:DNA-binding transcriptional LysR family regulator